MIQDNDGAGIRSTGDRNFLRVDHNYVYDGNHGYINSGIYFDWARNAIIDHNVVDNVWCDFANTKSYKVQQVANMMIYNNTFVATNHPTEPYTSGPFNFGGAGNDELAGLIVKNNIGVIHEPPAKGNYNAVGKPNVYGSADMTNNYLGYTEPEVGFVDYAGDDLQLSSSSTHLINQGVLVSDAVFDVDGTNITVPAYNDPVYSGSLPDLGAYEYGMPKWHVGAGVTLYNLDITSDDGTVTPGSRSYAANEQAVIKANGDLGYGFSHWTGDVPEGMENDNPLTLTMDGNKSVTANYVPVPTYTLTASLLPEGAGSGITISPAGGEYNQGTEVTKKYR